MKLNKIILSLSIFSIIFEDISAQTATVSSDVKPAETVEIDRSINPNVDTILKKSLPTVNIIDKGRTRTPEEEEAYQKLKRRVIKLYPYALMAKQIYETSAQATSSMSNKEKKQEKAKSTFAGHVGKPLNLN